VIDNRNYPVSRPFVWSPDSCGDVLFQIDIGDAVLTKRYTGVQAFPDFLRDFPGGRRTFYPKQFPSEKQALERMGVQFIRVNYQMFGAQDIVTGQPDPLPSRIPAEITDCWD
jgi:type VI secretion system protein ImpL